MSVSPKVALMATVVWAGVVLYLLVAAPPTSDSRRIVMAEVSAASDEDFIAWHADAKRGAIRLETTEVIADPTVLSDRLIIILSDFGRKMSTSQAALQRLPSEVSFSISPYSENPLMAKEMLSLSGRPVFADLPLEPRDYPYRDLGPLTLLQNVSRAENRAKIETILRDLDGVDALVGVGGGNFLADSASVNALLRELVDRRISMVSPPSAAANIGTIELPDDMSIRLADVVLLDQKGAVALREQLASIRQILEDEEKSVIAIGELSPLMISELATWLNYLPNERSERATKPQASRATKPQASKVADSRVIANIN